MDPELPQQPSLLDLSVAAFLARVANPDPAPGGGSAAALAGALAAALVEMVAGLARARSGSADREAAPAEIVAHAGDVQGRLALLVDEDAEAYARVTSAYRLPRRTEEERAARRASVQAALKAAAVTPMVAAQGCLEALQLAGAAAAVASRSAATDAGTGALLAHAALTASLRNLEANLIRIDDEDYVAEARGRAAALQAEGGVALSAALAAVERGA